MPSLLQGQCGLSMHLDCAECERLLMLANRATLAHSDAAMNFAQLVGGPAQPDRADLDLLSKHVRQLRTAAEAAFCKYRQHVQHRSGTELPGIV